MQLAIDRNSCVAAYYPDGLDVATLHPDCLAVATPDSAPVEVGQTWEVDLEAAKKAACCSIDAAAERLRNTVLTPGSGQMAAYQAKEEQARALLADDTPTEAEYPDIYNEIGLTADSAGEVAMAVLAAAERWRGYGRLVERTRLAGKKAVAEAEDAAGVVAARDSVAWP